MKYQVCRSSMLVAAALGANTFANTAVAQSSTVAEEKQAVSPVDQDDPAAAIIVTGTRSSGLRALEAPAPVSVLSSSSLQANAQPNLAAQLQFLDPSVNYPRSATGGTSAGNRVTTLRGLNPDQTLVLINGKRRHASAILNTQIGVGRGSSTTDLSLIPDLAVGRVEVLKDGAAAQYGSDAIAGVINIITNKDDKGTAIVLDSGVTDRGDGQFAKLSMRSGMSLGQGGHLTLALEARSSQPTYRGNVDSRVGYESARAGDPRQRALVGTVDIEVPAGAVDFYMFGSLGRRTARSQSVLILPPVSPKPYYPAVQIGVWDGEGTVGVKGPLTGEATFDLSTTYGVNSSTFNDDTINLSLVSRPGGSPNTFFGGRTRYSQSVTDALIGVPLGILRKSNLAIGGQYRREDLRNRTGEPDALFGAGPFTGVLLSSPVHYARDSYSIFGDFEATLVKGVDAALAGRYDHYSDFGGKFTWKASGRVEVTPFLALRGSASTGFRAPSVNQNGFVGVTAAFSSGALVSTAVLPVTDPVAQALGARPLKPETSKSYGAGAVLQLGGGFDATVDFYQIKIDDRIVLSDILGGANGGDFVRSLLASKGITNYQFAQFFGNLMNTRTRGVEAAAHYNRRLSEDDRVSLSAAFSTFSQKITKINNSSLPGAPQLILTNPALPPKLLYTIQGGQPENKFVLSGSWEHKALTINANLVRFGKFQAAPFDIIQTFGAQTVADISATLAVSPAFSFTLGVQNIGNSYPDAIKVTPVTSNNFGGSLRYTEFSPAGFNGRSYFVRAGMKF